MALPTYAELYRTFLDKHLAIADFPAETVYSLPMCLKRTDGIYDAFFIYSYPKNKEQMDPLRPFAWAAFAADGRPNSALNWCSVHDFVSTEHFPLGSSVSATLANSVGSARQGKAFGEAMQAYEKIRLFAFHHKPTVAQLQLISTYKKVFSEIVPQGLYPFYYALAPEFFDWIRFPLPHTALSTTPLPKDDEILEEVQRLHYILEDMEQQQRQVKEADQLVLELHNQLQEYRNDFLQDVTGPMERDLISLIDSIETSLEFHKGKTATPEQYQKLLALFEGIKEDLTDTLYRQGVDPYTVPGQQVQVPRQRVIDTTITPDKTLDKTIVRRLSTGWEKGDKVVRPEYVSAYLYTAPEPTETPAKETAPPRQEPQSLEKKNPPGALVKRPVRGQPSRSTSPQPLQDNGKGDATSE